MKAVTETVPREQWWDFSGILQGMNFALLLSSLILIHHA